jgi:hypothetical protein
VISLNLVLAGLRLGLKIERCVVDFMLLPIEKGKVYCTKVEPDVLFRYGDFLGGKSLFLS